MRFASIGSGSRGNATLVEAGASCVMIDCGFSAVEVERRMARLGRHPSQLAAILVTHEHGDHFSGVAALARKHSLPVWITAGTLNGTALDVPVLNLFRAEEPFVVGELAIEPFTVPHDAREPCQFVLSDGARRLGVLTDTGTVTPHVAAHLERLDALFLECNHDAGMLAAGPYPPLLKERVGGRFGHLSNAQAADLLRRIDCGRLQHLVAAHLSEKNNTPEHARTALSAALDCEPHWIGVADQVDGLDWRSLS